MTLPLLFATAAAIVLVRIGWGGVRIAAAFGWTLGLLALLALAVQNGAWGLSLGMVVALMTALCLVLYAGLTSPARTRRAPRTAPAIAIPRRPGDVARRVAVFALSVPVAFVAAQWLAFGIQAVVRGGATLDADAVTLTLFLQPVLWATIMTVQLTRARTSQMIAAPLVAAVAGTVLWGAA